MNKKTTPVFTTNTTPKKSQPKIGDKIRKIADELKQEQYIQIKTTSRILGATAQISENHERLIDEVVEMVNEDLDYQNKLPETIFYTVDCLKQQYKTLSEAKTNFNIKANSWAKLADKLNEQNAFIKNNKESSQYSVAERLIVIEKEVKDIHQEIQQIFAIVQQILINQK